MKSLLRDPRTSDKDLIFALSQASSADSKSADFKWARYQQWKKVRVELTCSTWVDQFQKSVIRIYWANQVVTQKGEDKALTELHKSMQKKLNSL